MPPRDRRLILAAILLASTLVRLHHVERPMADSLQAKQVYVANKARSIARPPLNPLRNTLDFLDDRGDRTVLTEEVPLYTGMLAVGYRVFGEREWVGHALSLCGTLLALVAFADLARRELRDDRAALAATALLASAPLFVFYGRAVLPDPWMLAGMLGAAACYRRFLDGEGQRWLIATAVCGALSALFKYFGLMVLIPLAEMTWRSSGSWRSLTSRRFLGLTAAMTVPVGLWMLAVFARTPNPVGSGWIDGKVYPYLVIQAPEVLLTQTFWLGLLGRFPFLDCGPVAAVLMAVGAIATSRGRAPRDGMTGSWSVMGVLFFFILAPKLRDHDYYELMLLPGAALWAVRGWRAIRALTPRFPRVGIAVLSIAAIVQSPWVMARLYRQDEGKLALAGQLERLCPEGGRVVAIGPGIEFPTVVHYSRREGWPLHCPTLPPDWRDRIERYRSKGAKVVAVLFEPKATPKERASYRPLIDSLPIIERRIGPINRMGGSCEYIILSLEAGATRR